MNEANAILAGVSIYVTIYFIIILTAIAFTIWTMYTVAKSLKEISYKIGKLNAILATGDYRDDGTRDWDDDEEDAFPDEE